LSSNCIDNIEFEHVNYKHIDGIDYEHIDNIEYEHVNYKHIDHFNNNYNYENDHFNNNELDVQ
jgi:hypothetical protein